MTRSFVVLRNNQRTTGRGFHEGHRDGHGLGGHDEGVAGDRHGPAIYRDGAHCITAQRGGVDRYRCVRGSLISGGRRDRAVDARVNGDGIFDGRRHHREVDSVGTRIVGFVGRRHGRVVFAQRSICFNPKAVIIGCVIALGHVRGPNIGNIPDCIRDLRINRHPCALFHLKVVFRVNPYAEHRRAAGGNLHGRQAKVLAFRFCLVFVFHVAGCALQRILECFYGAIQLTSIKRPDYRPVIVVRRFLNRDEEGFRQRGSVGTACAARQGAGRPINVHGDGITRVVKFSRCSSSSVWGSQSDGIPARHGLDVGCRVAGPSCPVHRQRSGI